MADIKHYYTKKLICENIAVEYSSEHDEIEIVIERQLVNGVRIGESYLRIHPSYVEPLCKLLKEVMVVDQDG